MHHKIHYINILHIFNITGIHPVTLPNSVGESLSATIGFTLFLTNTTIKIEIS